MSKKHRNRKPFEEAVDEISPMKEESVMEDIRFFYIDEIHRWYKSITGKTITPIDEIEFHTGQPKDGHKFVIVGEWLPVFKSATLGDCYAMEDIERGMDAYEKRMANAGIPVLEEPSDDCESGTDVEKTVENDAGMGFKNGTDVKKTAENDVETGVKNGTDVAKMAENDAENAAKNGTDVGESTPGEGLSE